MGMELVCLLANIFNNEPRRREEREGAKTRREEKRREEMSQYFWNSALYEKNHAFVEQYGESLWSYSLRRMVNKFWIWAAVRES
jgi:hypothetical protein